MMPLTISTGTKSYPVKTSAILLYALLLGGGYTVGAEVPDYSPFNLLDFQSQPEKCETEE